MIQDLDFDHLGPLITEHVTDPQRLAQICKTLDEGEIGDTLVVALDDNSTIVRWIKDDEQHPVAAVRGVGLVASVGCIDCG